MAPRSGLRLIAALLGTTVASVPSIAKDTPARIFIASDSTAQDYIRSACSVGFDFVPLFVASP